MSAAPSTYLARRESVWDYPRPPVVEPVNAVVEVTVGGQSLVRTDTALRVLETSHPPTVYIAWNEFPDGSLTPSRTVRPTMCEFKGRATYLDLAWGGVSVDGVGWTYVSPTAPYAQIANYVAIYPGRVDACYIDGHPVRPQGGDFYGGWATPNIEGPFKAG